MRLTRTPLMLIAGLALVLPIACGGDDSSGGAGGAALSDEAFCARISQLEEETDAMTADESDAMFLDAMTELRAAAPNDEVRDALGTFVDFFEEIDSLDENDPEAFERIFELAESPEFASAEAVLEDYSVNVCGFEPSE
ncbi:MAG: hypothetical protein EA389_04765 [Ilumatobacter sp.]|jgi:hypothetical protein|nr:MAG: hypothetical protein EA389_04765 [Ilumatobacter sp.]